MKLESTKTVFGSHYGIVVYEEISGDIVNPTVIPFETIASISGYRTPQDVYRVSINAGSQVVNLAVAEIEGRSLPNSWDGIYAIVAEITALANNTDTDPS